MIIGGIGGLFNPRVGVRVGVKVRVSVRKVSLS
jgi:hypothetical protein